MDGKEIGFLSWSESWDIIGASSMWSERRSERRVLFQFQQVNWNCLPQTPQATVWSQSGTLLLSSSCTLIVLNCGFKPTTSHVQFWIPSWAELIQHSNASSSFHSPWQHCLFLYLEISSFNKNLNYNFSLKFFYFSFKNKKRENKLKTDGIL